MKKKLCTLFLAAIMAFSICGCGQEEVVESVVDTLVESEEESSIEESIAVEESKEVAVVEDMEIPAEYDYSLKISINPQITFYMVEEKVLAWIMNNQDARDAYADVDFTGMTTEDAIKETIKTANDKGFFKDNATVYVVLTSPTEVFGQDVISGVLALTEKSIEEFNLNGTVKSSAEQQVAVEEESSETQVAQAETTEVKPEKQKEKDKEKEKPSNSGSTTNTSGTTNTDNNTNTESNNNTSSNANSGSGNASSGTTQTTTAPAEDKVVGKCSPTTQCSKWEPDGFTYTDRFAPHDKSEASLSTYTETDEQGRVFQVKEWTGPGGDRYCICKHCGGEAISGSMPTRVRKERYYEFTAERAEDYYQSDWNIAYNSVYNQAANELDDKFGNDEITWEQWEESKAALDAQANAYANSTVHRDDPKYQPYVINEVVFSDPAYNF